MQDPIAELLSQLSGVRRAAAVPYDRLLHPRHVSNNQSQNPQSISTALPNNAARKNVFPTPSSSQAVMLNENVGVPHQRPESEITLSKNEKRQFLLDR